MAHFDQPKDGLEAPVVDVALGRQVPALDGHHHSLQDVGSRRLLDRPRLRAVAGHVREHAGGVVAHLEKVEQYSADKLLLFFCPNGSPT